MKTLVNFISYALIVLVSVFMSISLVSCGEGYSEEDWNTPTPTPTPRDTTTTPTPSPKDTTTWSWNGLVRSDLSFDTTTEVVSAYNIGQISNPVKTVFDSIPLVYRLGVELKAPKRVVTVSPDTTVLRNARTSTTLNYGEYVSTAKDSVCTVSTGHTFPTQYYDITALTTSKRGYSLHAGHWEPFKFVTEKAQWSKIWHEPITEVTMNDSVFNREVVHNELVFKITSNGGKSWYIYREEVVVVDHFVKKIEEEPTPAEPEKVKADYWANNLKGFISCTKVWRDDSKSWSDAYLFECENTYEIILANYRVNDKKESFVSVEHKSVRKSVCPASGEYNGVIQVGGNFYPAAISIQSDGWDVIGVINGKVESQTHADQFANNSGIKNQNKNNNAKPSPFITTTKVENKVNGKLVIKVTAKTTTHTGVYTMADSSLK
jgi:hypothetical protein